MILRGVGQGTFVDVLERAPDQPFTGHPSWLCRTKGPLPGTLVAHGSGRPPRILRHFTIPPGGTVGLPDNNLQPIRPGRPPEATPAPPVELEFS